MRMVQTPYAQHFDPVRVAHPDQYIMCKKHKRIGSLQFRHDLADCLHQILHLPFGNHSRQKLRIGAIGTDMVLPAKLVAIQERSVQCQRKARGAVSHQNRTQGLFVHMRLAVVDLCQHKIAGQFL
jgi:hypothetical protein